jgi:hypothetical protein
MSIMDASVSPEGLYFRVIKNKVIINQKSGVSNAKSTNN